MTRRIVSPRSVLAVAALGAGLAFIDATIVNVAFPDIEKSFKGTSISTLSWVLNAYNICFAAFLVAAGRIADLLGRKRLFQVGVVVFTVASALCAVAPSVGTLIAFRVIQAIGAAIVVPASLALVLQAFDGKERTRGVALWSASAALAAGVGPSLGGVLVELGGWRLAFLVNLPVGVLAMWAARRVLVESRAPGRRSVPDLRGALMLALAVSALTLGIVKGPEWGWTDPRVLVSWAIALAVGAAFLYRCTWHRFPMLDLGLFRIRSIATANLLTLAGAAGFYAYVLCNVLFLTSVWRYSVLDAGLALTPGPFVAAAVAGPAGKLADRVGQRWVVSMGGLVWAAGMIYMVQRIGLRPDFVSEWLPGMVLLGIGAGITFPVIGSASVAAVTGGRFATATGLNSISRQLGAVLGVAILVAIIGTPSPLEAANAFDNGWRFAAGCFLFVAVLAPFIGPIRRPEEDQPLLADRKGAGARIPAVAPRVPGVAAAEAAPPIGQRSAAEAIATVPLFSSLSDATRERLAASAHSVRVRASEWLFRQGEEADGLYVVVAGRLEAIAVDGDDENLLRILGPGSVVGELALLADTTRSASVRARRDTELLSLRRSDFEALVSEDPAFAKALLGFMGGLLQKSRALEPPPPPPAQTLALVPLSAGAPVGEVCDALLAELVHDGTAVRLDGPSGDESQGMLTGLLERYERDYNHLVLMARAPADADPWSDFCLRHADRVVAVATRGGVPAWAAADERFAGCDLVYADVTGEGIGDWIDALAAKARHLVRPGDSLASAQAAARRIAGRSVGVVLSGGGARGFAHLGVMKELLDAGIHIDRIGGVSMGALIGGMFAQGMSFEEVDARIYEEFVRTNPLGDYRMPRHSLVRGERLRSGIVRSFDVPIEQMPRDFFAVSSDIVSGELVVHRRGSSSRAVIATVCLPGMLPPLVDGERMLVDGGVLNNLPVDVMAAAGEGPVVAADVTQRFDPWAYLREDSDGAAHNGNGRVRRARADDADDVLPGLMETVMRSLLLGSVDTAEAAREHADLVITPENDGVGLLEWHQMDRAVEAGRRAAVDALERAPAAIFA